MLEGLLITLAPSSILVIFIGVFIGILVGSLPGFTATMGTALLLPFTFAMPPGCLLYTSPSPRDRTRSRMPSSA